MRPFRVGGIDFQCLMQVDNTQPPPKEAPQSTMQQPAGRTAMTMLSTISATHKIFRPALGFLQVRRNTKTGHVHKNDWATNGSNGLTCLPPF